MNIKTGTTRRALELPTPAEWEKVYKTLDRKVQEIRTRYGNRVQLKIMLPAFLQGHYEQWRRTTAAAMFYHVAQYEVAEIRGVTISWDSPTLEAWLYDVMVISGYDGMDLSYRLPIWETQGAQVHALPDIIDDVIVRTAAVMMNEDHDGGTNKAMQELKAELVRKYLGTC